jgi:hypothetical protein
MRQCATQPTRLLVGGCRQVAIKCGMDIAMTGDVGGRVVEVQKGRHAVDDAHCGTVDLYATCLNLHVSCLMCTS